MGVDRYNGGTCPPARYGAEESGWRCKCPEQGKANKLCYILAKETVLLTMTENKANSPNKVSKYREMSKTLH